MKKVFLSMAAVPMLLGGLSVSASAADGISIFDDLKFSGDLRPRYEYADVKDNGKDAANAYTVRTKLNVNAKLFGIEGLSSNVGIISVNDFGSNTYNSTANGLTQYDVIKDSEFAMISNADINYQIGKTTFHAGRSQVNLDNQRFIGTVAWRQLERSYDTVYVADNSVEGLNVLAAWVYGLQGVGAGETTDTNSVLLHASYDVIPELKITAYDYMIASVSDTIGIALTGNVDLGAKLDYRAEYAMQKDATMEIHDVAAKADATYYNLDLGANFSGILAGINYEMLSGADGSKTTFNPVLGTNHKFNGWADVFYVANKPTGGLVDANIRLGYTAKGLGKVLVVYHDFKADTDMASTTGTTDDLGSEFDMMYANAIPGVKNLSGLVKYASYAKGTATGYTNDKTVAWVQLDYKF